MTAELGADLVSLAEKGGGFVAGAIFAAVFCHSLYLIASRERIERDKLDRAQMAELFRQMQQKDKRIDELHERLSKQGKSKK